MNVDGRPFRTIWIDENGQLKVIDQRLLPHRFVVISLSSHKEVCEAIRNMTVRGAGLIGAAAGYGMWLAACEASVLNPKEFHHAVTAAAEALKATRPTAGNLARAVKRQLDAVNREQDVPNKVAACLRTAQEIADEDAAFCKRIGEHGLTLIRNAAASKKPGEPVHILTHCNAGWLAFVDYGSALAPIYAAYTAGLPIHVWVDETRPRNQGASLTAWELAQHGIPHDLIADNAGGHLMQHGLVDLVITGADRVTRRGDAANKIGTYLKALAARDNNVPFYVAFPSSTFDFSMIDGVAEIPIEERDPDEVRLIAGLAEDGPGKGDPVFVRLCGENTPARNWSFDVTPARLISGLICERGICPADEQSILKLFPEQAVQECSASKEEGVIRFTSRHVVRPLVQAVAETFPECSPIFPHLLEKLDAARSALRKRGLIGVSPQGVGYGNISARIGSAAFVITGSGTGGMEHPGENGYALVREFSPENNRVESSGPIRPSSEAMTHGAIYAAQPKASCVVHIHHRPLFMQLVQKGITTPADAAYGTPELSAAVRALAAGLPLGRCLFAALGHADGVFCYAASIAEALELVVRAVDQTLSSDRSSIERCFGEKI